MAIVALVVVAGIIAWRIHVGSARKPIALDPNARLTFNSGAQKSASSRPLTKPSPSKPMQVTPTTPVPTAESADNGPPAPSDAGATPVPQEPPAAEVRPIPLGPLPWTFRALHKHGFGGGCEGELRFEDDRLTFTSAEHPLSLARGQIQGLDADGFKDGRGKNWHFEIQGMTPGQVRGVFSRWLRAAGPA